MKHVDEKGRHAPAQSKIAKKLNAYDIGLQFRLNNARHTYMQGIGEGLHNYNAQSQKEWLRGLSPPKDGNLTIYRAVSKKAEKRIRPGDYVSNSRSYVQGHIEANMGGEAHVLQTRAHLSELRPADGPGEFWYYPHDEHLYEA